MIVVNNSDHGHAIAQAAWASYDPASNVCIAREESGKLLAGVIYGSYTGPAIWSHLAVFAPNGLSRSFIFAAVSYPFHQLKCEQILAQLPSNNPKILEFCRKFGFNPVAIIPNAIPGGDIVIASLERANCRWLETCKVV